jgi:hypothetical protein
MRALILLCLTLMAVSPAHAELRDLRARLSGSEGQVWLAFDGQPTRVRSERTPSGLELILEGVSASARQIIPRDQDLVTRVQLEPLPDGVRILLQGASAWSGAEAQLRQGGILVRLHLGAGELPAMAAASSYPATDPAWAPTAAPAPEASTAPAVLPIAEPAHAPAQRLAATPIVHTPDPAPVSPPDPQPAPAPAHLAAPAPAADEPDTPRESPARASAFPAQAAAMAAAALPADLTACPAAAAAVEANPWDDASLMQHAACLGRAGEASQAARIYEQMLAFEPDDVTALMALADLRLQQGDNAAARSLYLRAADHANSDAQAMRARGQAEALRPR